MSDPFTFIKSLWPDSSLKHYKTDPARLQAERTRSTSKVVIVGMVCLTTVLTTFLTVFFPRLDSQDRRNEQDKSSQVRVAKASTRTAAIHASTDKARPEQP